MKTKNAFPLKDQKNQLFEPKMLFISGKFWITNTPLIEPISGRDRSGTPQHREFAGRHEE